MNYFNVLFVCPMFEATFMIYFKDFIKIVDRGDRRLKFPIFLIGMKNKFFKIFFLFLFFLKLLKLTPLYTRYTPKYKIIKINHKSCFKHRINEEFIKIVFSSGGGDDAF